MALPGKPAKGVKGVKDVNVFFETCCRYLGHLQGNNSSIIFPCLKSRHFGFVGEDVAGTPPKSNIFS